MIRYARRDDDESYFTQSESEINRNENVYLSNVELVTNVIKFKTKDKFEDKLLVYLIIFPYGISEPYLTSSRIANSGDFS